MEDQDITIYQENRITQSRYEFTVIEKRIIYQIIKEIRNKYVMDTSQDQNLFGELVLRLTHEQLKVVSDDSNLIYKSIRRLVSKFYEFDNEEEWMILGIINKAKHKKKIGHWEVTVDSDMVAKFVELAKNYTSYSLLVAMSLRSEHSQRLYEYCSQFRAAGGWRVSIKDLRFKMRLEKKYIRYASLKKRVIDVAKNELKKMFSEGQSDLYFEYSETKNGRSVESLNFKIIIRGGDEYALSLNDQMYMVRTDLEKIFDTSTKPKNKEFVNKTMSALLIDPEYLKHCFAKLAFVKTAIPKEERAQYMRFVIKEEYLKNG